MIMLSEVIPKDKQLMISLTSGKQNSIRTKDWIVVKGGYPDYL